MLARIERCKWETTTLFNINSNADECESNRRGKGKPVNAIALFALFSLGAVLIVFTVRIFIHANSIHIVGFGAK